MPVSIEVDGDRCSVIDCVFRLFVFNLFCRARMVAIRYVPLVLP